MFKISVFSFLSILFGGSQLWAAACCGGGFALPSLITGDDKAQITASYSYSQLDTRVLDSGVWRKQKDQDLTQMFRLEGAHIFADRFQVGMALPLLARDQGGPAGGEASGFGDAQAQVAYEFLPDWDYNPWRPKGHAFLSLTAPTGSSQYDSSALYTNRGRGFWTLGTGAIFTKAWRTWDALALVEVHRRFAKEVDNENFKGEVTPGFGHSVTFGAGYNWKNWRWGSALAWTSEDAISDGNQGVYTFSAERYATFSVLTSYAFSPEWFATATYADQTFFGDPTNTTLSRSVAFLLQRRWAR